MNSRGDEIQQEHTDKNYYLTIHIVEHSVLAFVFLDVRAVLFYLSYLKCVVHSHIFSCEAGDSTSPPDLKGK